MTKSPPEPRPIPVPEDFQFEWDDPADANLSLTQDKQHMASPMTPFSGWVHQNYWAAGASAGIGALSQPLMADVRRINGYYYVSFHPNVPPEQMEEAGHRAEEGLKAAMPVFVDRWANEWEPEVRKYHESWESFDLQGASDAELIEHFKWTIETYQRLWHIHMEGLLPALVSISMFADLYADLVEGSGPLDAYKLLQGVENESLRAGSDLWEISRTVNGDVRDTLLNTPTSEVMSTLEESETGRELSEKITQYIDKWGRRSDTVIEFSDPSWVEDPTIAIDNLKGYVRNPDSDPIAKWNELVAERERLVEEVQDLIAGYPDPVKEQFNHLLHAGQHGQRLQEDHNWWIDQQGTHYVRQVALEIGRRLVSNSAIAGRDDVFMLTGDEILQAASDGLSGDLKSTVLERQGEMERWSKLDAPLLLGTDYGPPPDNPITRTLGKFFNYGPKPGETDDVPPDVLPGVSGSAGKVTGTARVILKLSDAGRLSPGEILVTVTTSPPWTPLFATAGGIVTDTGGPLSHCAIVAREYGLPATVGTGRATKLIKDGQKIEVDGVAGTVRLLS